MIPFNILVVIIAGLWLLSFTASLFAIWLGCLASSRRFKGALGFSVAGLAIAIAGLNWFHFSFSKTTNDSSFTLDSKWFFLAAIGLALLALALAFLGRRGSPPSAC
jgi:hypothetical protein